MPVKINLLPLFDSNIISLLCPKGTVQLMDMRDALPGLVRRQGIAAWQLMVRQL